MERTKGFIDFKTKILGSATDEYIDIEGYANRSDVIDRDNDQIPNYAFNLNNFKDNPILLYMHKRDEVAGKVLLFEVREKGLYIKARVFKDVHPVAYSAVKNGVVTTLSIGFVGNNGHYVENRDIWLWTDIELLEISLVSVPSNPQSIFETVNNNCDDNSFCLASKAFKCDKKQTNKIEGEYMGEVNELLQATKSLVDVVKENTEVIKGFLSKSVEKQPKEQNQKEEKSVDDLIAELKELGDEALVKVYETAESLVNEKLKQILK